jgi:hypothetical protein
VEQIKLAKTTVKQTITYNYNAIAVVNEVKTNISLPNMKLKHEDELDKIINVKQHSNHALSTDVVFITLQTNQGAHIRYYAYEWKQ